MARGCSRGIESTADSSFSLLAEADGSPRTAECDGLRCEECNDLFSSHDFNRHWKTHGARERKFFCRYCPYSSDYGSTITRHEMTHTGERPYACNVCGRAFGTKHHLVTHLRSHTGERPYDCDMCDKAFMTSSDLSRHKKTHASDAPFVCRECGKGYACKENLLAHCILHYKSKS